jgi:PadR family transcriptional regulator, regulatory protein PadR
MTSSLFPLPSSCFTCQRADLLVTYRSMPTESQSREPSQVLRGTLEMLALKMLTVEPMNGWEISVRLRQISRDVFDVNQGSLYPALQKMLREGCIKAEWRASDNNRRARYYSITREGQRQLEAEISEWERSSGAVNRVLRFALQGG